MAEGEHRTVIFVVSFLTIFMLLVTQIPVALFANQSSEYDSDYAVNSYPSSNWDTSALGSNIITDYDNDSIGYTDQVVLTFTKIIADDTQVKVYWLYVNEWYYYHLHHVVIIPGIWEFDQWYPIRAYTKEFIESNIPAGESVSSFYVTCTDIQFITQITYDSSSYSSFNQAWNAGDMLVLCGYTSNQTSTEISMNAWTLIGNLLTFQGFHLHPDTNINFVLNAIFASGPIWICIIILIAYFMEKILPFF